MKLKEPKDLEEKKWSEKNRAKKKKQKNGTREQSEGKKQGVDVFLFKIQPYFF